MATVINQLSPATIHKIAAGEVIERPANVVKELVENALDAGATKVVISLEEGGLDLIKVSDNGKGMVREDAMTAWLPHTTSKIREVEDLQFVVTYGFRGEALCSMAAVAELTIETRHASEPTGLSVTILDSIETGNREISRNPGTTITVRNLFLHNPARRKFMGSGKNEAGRIMNMLSRVALAHPGTSFRVVEKGREALSLAEGTLKHRVGEVLGFNITNELVPVDWSDDQNGGRGSIHVEGYVCTPQQARLRSTHQYFFINRRVIQSGLISRALSQSYDVLPPGRFPMAVLYLTMPTEEVDVNVHPTKKEVRFLNESRIYWAISQAVKNALRKMVDAPMLDLHGPLDGPQALAVSFPEAESNRPGMPQPFVYSPFTPSASRIAEAEGDSRSASAASASAASASAASASAASASAAPAPPASAAFPGALGVTDSLLVRPGHPSVSNQIRLFPADARPAPPVSRFFPDSGIPSEAAGSKPRLPEVPYLQLHNGFILFGVESGLMMVNQQAAHERIMYEKALEELRQPGRFSSQQLLFPEVLELPPADSLFLEEHLDRLQALGFDLESFGGNTFQLRGLPIEVKPDQARRVVHEMVEGMLRPERGAIPNRSEDFQQRLAKVYSRVTSVKLGEHLDYPQVSALIDGLFATQNPYVSPSGAPIVVRYSMEEIHRKFGLKT
ncbi:MAG: DNA mismatch repair endonuclease MutL [Fibrobacterota bacterium]|nr:DNA mismatch repair endonuclease MutL [Fibrobacterota bacterium]